MSRRATYEQKRRLLEYMKEHRDFAVGRVDSPDGNQIKKRLMEELASTLNSFAEGANKTPDKWMKVWADWKVDTKKKARLRREYQRGTGGGPPPAPLTALEEEVLAFLGPVAVEGLPVPDTLELPERDLSETSRGLSLSRSFSERSRSRSPLAYSSSEAPLSVPAAPELQVTFDEPRGGDAQTGSRDPMLNAMRLQAEAAMRQAVALERFVAAVERLAAVAEQAERRAAAADRSPYGEQ